MPETQVRILPESLIRKQICIKVCESPTLVWEVVLDQLPEGDPITTAYPNYIFVILIKPWAAMGIAAQANSNFKFPKETLENKMANENMTRKSVSSKRTSKFVEPNELIRQEPKLTAGIAAQILHFFRKYDETAAAAKCEAAIRDAYQEMYRWAQSFDVKAVGIASHIPMETCVAGGLLTQEEADAYAGGDFHGLYFDSFQKMAAAKRLCWASFNEFMNSAKRLVADKRAAEKTRREALAAARKEEMEKTRSRRQELRRKANAGTITEEEKNELDQMMTELQARQARIATSLGDSPALKAISARLAAIKAHKLPEENVQAPEENPDTNVEVAAQ